MERLMSSRYCEFFTGVAIISLVAAIPVSLFFTTGDAMYWCVSGMAWMLYVCLPYLRDIAMMMHAREQRAAKAEGLTG